ncbi:MAG TPA: methyltransferase domain-containing protein [Acidimicrobiales bacterium]|jgi:SAM-dependent methyltransferase
MGDAGVEPSAARLGFNKACELEDFSHPDLRPLIADLCDYKREVFQPGFPAGAEHRKDWEVAMAVRSLRKFGAVRPDATVLGVAAGAEDTVFHLTQYVARVFATDIYLNPGPWQPLAPLAMLIEPAEFAPGGLDVNRLVVQHMDGRCLRYPDDSFDGIFSSGSIEHFGTLADVAASAHEMGRVLKPGGVLALSTELCISGPPGGRGWSDDTLLFSIEDLHRYIVEASGLEMVDELSISASAETMATTQNLGQALHDHLAQVGAQLGRPGPTTWTAWRFPYIVLEEAEYVFRSVHLTLRKTDDYPLVPNEWAKPTAALVESITAANKFLLDRAGAAVADAATAAARQAAEARHTL